MCLAQGHNTVPPLGILSKYINIKSIWAGPCEAFNQKGMYE